MASRVHLIYGNQDLLIREQAEQWISHALEARDREWALERVDLADLSKSGPDAEGQAESLLNSCESPPMFVDRKVLRLDNLQVLKQPKKEDSGLLAQVFHMLAKVLSAPPEHLWFLLTSSATRETDLSKPLLTLIRKHGGVQKCVAYDNDNPVRWVIQRCGAKGLRIQQPVAQALIDLVGNDLSDLDQTLEKLSLLQPNAQIDEALLRQHVLGHKHHSVFFMTESLSRKNLKAALETLDQQLEEAPREHVRLYALVVQQIRKMLLVHLLQQQGVTESTLLGKLGMPPFLGKQLVAQARGFQAEQLEQWLLELARNDLRVKFNARLAPLLLKNFFQQVCNSPRTSSAPAS